MRSRCDLFLSDHRERGDTRCIADPDHTRALERRAAGARPWALIQRGRDSGGDRDFLEGKPINCGRGLELQGQRVESDDYGDFSLLTDEPVSVRYELEDGKIVLFTELGGHIARLEHNAWMRFRWRTS